MRSEFLNILKRHLNLSQISNSEFDMMKKGLKSRYCNPIVNDPTSRLLSFLSMFPKLEFAKDKVKCISGCTCRY